MKFVSDFTQLSDVRKRSNQLQEIATNGIWAYATQDGEELIACTEQYIIDAEFVPTELPSLEVIARGVIHEMLNFSWDTIAHPYRDMWLDELTPVQHAEVAQLIIKLQGFELEDEEA